MKIGCVREIKADKYRVGFIVDQIVHYCIGNMPGAVPYTSTLALTNSTLRYGLAIADFGFAEASRRIPGLSSGLNTTKGKCTNSRVAEYFRLNQA